MVYRHAPPVGFVAPLPKPMAVTEAGGCDGNGEQRTNDAAVTLISPGTRCWYGAERGGVRCSVVQIAERVYEANPGPRIFGGVDNEAGLGWTWGRRRRRGVAGYAEA